MFLGNNVTRNTIDSLQCSVQCHTTGEPNAFSVYVIIFRSVLDAVLSKL